MNTCNKESLKPIFKENSCTIVASSSNEYTPYLSVFLESIKQNSKKENNYDVIIFERAITEENKEILTKQFASTNRSLRFTSPMSIIAQYDLRFPSTQNLECYFRLASPLILEKYDKILFTDIDLVFENDPKILYDTANPENLAACQDMIYCAYLNTEELKVLPYAKEELELSNPYEYYNTGVMILNLKYFRENNLTEKLLEMCSEKMYQIMEQDVLNKFFKNKITYIPYSWNFETLNQLTKMHIKNFFKEHSEIYHRARKKPNVVHWAGSGKAWKSKKEDMAKYWWKYALKTPYSKQFIKEEKEYSKRKNPFNKIKLILSI